MMRKMTASCLSVCIIFLYSSTVSANLNIIDFREIFDEHRSIMLLIDVDTGLIIYSNEAAIDFYGYSKEQLLSMSIQDINTLSPEETERERRAAVEEERNFFLFDHRLANGDVRNVEVYSYPIEIQGQKFLYSIINDVTASVAMKQAISNRNLLIYAILILSVLLQLVAIINLIKRRNEINQMKVTIQASEEIFRELFGNIKIGIFLHRLNRENLAENSLIMANNYAKQLLGYEEAELMQRKLVDFVAEDCQEKFSEYMTEIIENGQTADETKLVTSDNQILNVGFRSHTFSINNKEMVLTAFQDITENIKKEKELRMLYRAIEQSPSVVVITDPKGSIQYTNKKFSEVTGYLTHEAIGNQPTLYKDDSEASMKIYKETWDAIHAGQQWKGEFANKRKNGSMYWARSVIAPILAEDGELLNIISMHDDITERKEMEQKIINANRELMEALDERKLLEQQLIQKEKMSAIGQLAAGVAHEINNPLGYVMSNFESIKKYIHIYDQYLDLYNQEMGERNENKSNKQQKIQQLLSAFEKRHQIEFIKEDFPDLLTDSYNGLDRIKKIVQSLREFSRMETLDDFGPYDVNDGIGTTLEIANNEIKYYAKVEKNLQQIPTIDAIPHQINQVLLNLIVNAAQAIKGKQMEGMGLITISTHADKEFVYMSIEDNGVGIDEKNLSQIFNPFFTTKPVGSGTGLGLSISYDIVVNKHKGEITAKSTMGVGSTFVVKLPIQKK